MSALLLASRLQGQVPTAAQNSTLAGLREVALIVAGVTADSALRSQAAALLVGGRVKVVADSADIDASVDGVMTLNVVKSDGALGTEYELRLTVSQWVEVTRTHQSGQLPTWSYEVRGNTVRDFHEWLRVASK